MWWDLFCRPSFAFIKASLSKQWKDNGYVEWYLLMNGGFMFHFSDPADRGRILDIEMFFVGGKEIFVHQWVRTSFGAQKLWKRSRGGKFLSPKGVGRMFSKNFLSMPLVVSNGNGWKTLIGSFSLIGKPSVMSFNIPMPDTGDLVAVPFTQPVNMSMGGSLIEEGSKGIPVKSGEANMVNPLRIEDDYDSSVEDD
ncbi:hypothetical protein NE237_028039 [Protea cynaroides]|uniref:DUF4283 domain-containing protein n=1 Tax=Protea cynaroides TaxID=273540 RepID=A0A9Q0GSH0_9MAGN|nr:hypothetical protein NE237_028039 [Protea cynaroides]